MSSSLSHAMEIVRYLSDVTKQDIVHATQEQLDALLTRVWNERKDELKTRFKIKGFDELKKQVETARLSAKSAPSTQPKSAEVVARENADNNEKKSWWKDYVVSPKDVPLIGGIPILSHAVAALGTVLTAKPVEGAVTNISYKVIGKEGWRGSVSRFLGTAARVAAMVAMGYYGWKLWNHVTGLRADAAVDTIMDVQEVKKLANVPDSVTYGGGSAASGSTGVAPNVIGTTVNTAPINPADLR
jgi:hypothetical protein